MRLTPGASASLGDVLVLLLPLLARANAAVAGGLWLQPSSKWLGVDGTWSTFELAIGGPAVTVQLLPNTALSEIWAVSKNICRGAQQCITDRGGVYDPTASTSCTSLGTWALGLTDAGWNESNGVYGLDTVAVHNSLTGTTSDVNGALVAAIESIEYYQGYIGLGVTQGKFNNKVVNPFISQLAETYGTIPSHSYGYTAGFIHAEPSCPGSLVLGGYDPLRFESHNTAFRLNPDTRLPQARLRGITVQAADGTSAPSSWNGSSSSLVTMKDSLMVVIDTSLPYLTLPQLICDRFASALDLVFNDTLGVYTYRTVDQYNSFLKAKPFNFTFSLSAWDNTDDFGKPLETRGVVNVTLSSAAFAQLLRFPYQDIIKNVADPAIPYFPLRRAKNVNEIVLGRVFMQQAYIVTKYDEEVFSIYQARFPANAAVNYTVESIARSPNSEYPEFVGVPQSKGPGLDAGQTAGIVVSVLLVSAICAFLLWCCRRRRRRRRAAKELALPVENQDFELKDTESAIKPPDAPLSPVARMFVFLQGRRRTRMVEETGDGNDGPQQPAEADASHERYEMAAPVVPVELAANEINSSDETTELGTEGSQHNVSEYELERRKLHRQLHGPLPLYTPPTRSLNGTADEEGKSEQDISPVAHYRPETGESSSPISPPSEGNNSNSLPSLPLPSPVSPRDPDWSTLKMSCLPSPMTLAPQYPPGLFARSNSDAGRSPTSSPTAPSLYKQTRQDADDFGLGRSVSSSSQQSGSRPSPISDGSQSPTFQRSPIDQQEIICLGPLPDHVRLPLQTPPKTRRQQPPTPQLIGPEGRKIAASPIQEDPSDVQSNPAQTKQTTPRLASPALSSSSAEQATAPPPRFGNSPPPQLRIDPGLAVPVISRVRRGSADTLGSNYTVEEEERIQVEFTRQQSLRNAGTPTSPNSFERFDPAAELVHVPQVPEKRYSWEEDKR